MPGGDAKAVALPDVTEDTNALLESEADASPFEGLVPETFGAGNSAFTLLLLRCGLTHNVDYVVES